MKGIILAGGTGSRLYPSTLSVCKQLLPVYDKPMIYYPISVLMLAGIKDILIITSPCDLDLFKNLLKDGSQLGLNISYAIQQKPEGIAQAFLIAKDFVGDDNSTLILGDNIFYGTGLTGVLRNNIKDVEQNGGAHIFAVLTKTPKRFGIVEFDEEGKVKQIIEKPENPPSNYAVCGIYMYDNKVFDYVKNLKKSERGEYEITDLNNLYLKDNKLKVEKFLRGITWLDTGTHKSLINAGLYIHTIEENQGIKIACLEEIALNLGYITKDDIISLVEKHPNNSYCSYLKAIVAL